MDTNKAKIKRPSVSNTQKSMMNMFLAYKLLPIDIMKSTAGIRAT